MRDQARINIAEYGMMAYRMKKYEGGNGGRKKVPSFSVDEEEFLFTSIPVAVTS